MSVDTQTQAILLLTAHLGTSAQVDAKPLKPGEWGRFASWLHAEGKRPEELLESGDAQSMLNGWSDQSISQDRVLKLLGRAAALGMVLEKWERAGLWVIVRSHPDYPAKLKKRLGPDSPAVLIGCGNRRLLNAPGIAVVGSRDASEEDLQFTCDLGRRVAEDGYIIVSGGARGVDEAGMYGCIEAGGKAVGVLADSLIRAVTSQKYRNALATDQVALVTPFNPEAGFNVGNAMARNKYIYCCSDAAVIVASGKNKGGTWSGAIEAMRSDWVPVWARHTQHSPEGNTALIQKGANDLGDRMATPDELITSAAAPGKSPSEFLFANNTDKEIVSANTNSKEEIEQSVPSPTGLTPGVMAEMSFVEFLVVKLAGMSDPSGITVAEIADALDVTKAQVQAWLKQALQRDLVVKSTRPVRYSVAGDAIERIDIQRQPK
jgi:predicted Rossmann fold nucleotide-binding protein DprA/Smf involved in DNA uptake